MCESEGMALAPWGALGRGAFGTHEELEAKAASKEGRKNPPTEKTKAISLALEKIAKAKGTTIVSVAQAYVMAKSPYVFPIVGGRKIEHLKSNIEALGVELSEEDLTASMSSPFDTLLPTPRVRSFSFSIFFSFRTLIPHASRRCNPLRCRLPNDDDLRVCGRR